MQYSMGFSKKYCSFACYFQENKLYVTNSRERVQFFANVYLINQIEVTYTQLKRSSLTYILFHHKKRRFETVVKNQRYIFRISALEIDKTLKIGEFGVIFLR